MIQIKTKTIVIAIVCLFALTFAGGFWIGHSQRDHASESIITSMNDINRTYLYKINDLQRTARLKDAMIMSQREAIAEGLAYKEELRLLKIKHLSDINKLKGQVNVLTDSIEYVDSKPPVEVYIDEEHPVLYLPLVFGEQNDYLHLRGEFDEDGALSMDINMPLSIDIYTHWINRGKEYKTTITHGNPYISNLNIRSAVLDLRKPKQWGLSVVGGYGIVGNGQLKPFLGLGISYDLWQF